MHQICIICKKKYGNICKNIDSMFTNMQKYAKNMQKYVSGQICKNILKYMHTYM